MFALLTLPINPPLDQHDVYSTTGWIQIDLHKILDLYLHIYSPIEGETRKWPFGPGNEEAALYRVKTKYYVK